MRKAFNFYKSYFDVYNELSTDKDKVQFIEALLQKQFNGIEPEGLKGVVKLAYISQKHSIDQQVNGYESKTGNILNNNPSKGGTKPSSIQEQEKEKEKVKEEEKQNREIPTLEEFIQHAKEKKPNVSLEAVRLKYEAWKDAGWVNGNNKKIKNWKSSLTNTINYLPEEKYKLRYY